MADILAALQTNRLQGPDGVFAGDANDVRAAGVWDVSYYAQFHDKYAYNVRAAGPASTRRPHARALVKEGAATGAPQGARAALGVLFCVSHSWEAPLHL